MSWQNHTHTRTPVLKQMDKWVCGAIPRHKNSDNIRLLTARLTNIYMV